MLCAVFLKSYERRRYRSSLRLCTPQASTNGVATTCSTDSSTHRTSWSHPSLSSLQHVVGLEIVRRLRDVSQLQHSSSTRERSCGNMSTVMTRPNNAHLPRPRCAPPPSSTSFCIYDAATLRHSHMTQTTGPAAPAALPQQPANIPLGADSVVPKPSIYSSHFPTVYIKHPHTQSEPCQDKPPTIPP